MAATTQSRPATSTRRSTVSETAVAGHRRGGGWRGGGLRSVRAQLVAPILVATAGLVVLGTLQTISSATVSSDARRTRLLAQAAVHTVRLVHEVDRELAETIALRDRGGKAGVQLVTGQRERTDTIAKRFRSASRDAGDAVPGIRKTLRVASDVLDELKAAREASLAKDTSVTATGDKVFADLANALLDVADSLPAHVADAGLANQARTVAMMAAIEHDISLERAAIRAILVTKRLQPGDLVSVASLEGQRGEHLDEFNRAADDAARAKYQELVRGVDVDMAIRKRQAVINGDKDASGLHADPDTWYTESSNMIRRVNLVGLRLSDRLDASAAEMASDAWRSAVGTAFGTFGVAVVALITAVFLAIRTSRRLRRLREAALQVARKDLPDAILAVVNGTVPPDSFDAGFGGGSLTTTGAPLDMSPNGAGARDGQSDPASAAAVTRELASANDEIGEVADAFATVHRSALRLAGQQAELRIDVARMAEILARRIRTLITRQLRLLDEFEREETDPDVLARLFALDHLAARLRRNGENLLVLAGGEPGRAFSQAFPLAAVVTAAASEIEEFARVEAALGDIMIVGPVVGDLVHLLAELLENATAFSPPDTAVRVDARRTIDGAVVRVHDSGIGIVPSRLEEINKRLSQPATLTSAAAGTMGLHVVAHLASRHGIRVQLYPTGTGTVAYVALPHSTLSSQPAIAPAPRGVSLEVGTPGRPALVATRATTPEPPSESRDSVGYFSQQTTQPVPVGAAARASTADSPAMAPVAEAPRDWFRPSPNDGEHSGANAPLVGVPTAGAPPAGFPPSGFPAVTAPAAGSASAGLGRPGTPKPDPPMPSVSAALSMSATAPMPTLRPTTGAPATPSVISGSTAIRVPAQRVPPQDQRYTEPPSQPETPVTSAIPMPFGTAGFGDGPPRRFEDQSMSAAGVPSVAESPDTSEDRLPRRSPGAMLAPGASAPPAPAAVTSTVDPEAVRARLSAFAEGVSAALRRTTLPS